MSPESLKTYHAENPPPEKEIADLRSRLTEATARAERAEGERDAAIHNQNGFYSHMKQAMADRDAVREALRKIKDRDVGCKETQTLDNSEDGRYYYPALLQCIDRVAEEALSHSPDAGKMVEAELFCSLQQNGGGSLRDALRRFIRQLKTGAKVPPISGDDAGGIVSAATFRSIAEQLEALLAATPPAQGITDGERLDWLDANLVSMSHARATCSVYMDGTTIQGQVLNDRSKGGGTFRKIKGRSIREAIDAAIRSAQPSASGNGDGNGGEG